MSLAFEHSNGLNAKWRAAVDAHRAHAAAEWPREAAGLVLPDGSYQACANVSDRPLTSFELSEGVFEAADPVAVLHSHTSEVLEDGTVIEPQDCPSAEDMLRQPPTAVPWGITIATETGASDPFWFGDEVPRPDLYGRRFRHGVDDCYSFVRDWHREVPGILIPDFPRDPHWWEAPEDPDQPRPDLYMAGFESAGFVRTRRTVDEILPGDCFICKLRSSVMNHAGVYLGDGLIGHHIYGYLSKKDPASGWRPKLLHLVRHRDLPEDWTP